MSSKSMTKSNFKAKKMNEKTKSQKQILVYTYVYARNNHSID